MILLEICLVLVDRLGYTIVSVTLRYNREGEGLLSPSGYAPVMRIHNELCNAVTMARSQKILRKILRKVRRSRYSSAFTMKEKPQILLLNEANSKLLYINLKSKSKDFIIKQVLL